MPGAFLQFVFLDIYGVLLNLWKIENWKDKKENRGHFLFLDTLPLHLANKDFLAHPSSPPVDHSAACQQAMLKGERGERGWNRDQREPIDRKSDH